MPNSVRGGEMAKSFELEVVTPERTVLKKTVEYVSVPTVDGAYGILADHAPMVGLIKTGVLHFRSAGKTEAIAVMGGFFEVADNRMLVLGDEAETPEEVDVAAALEEQRRAREVIEAGGDQEAVLRARANLERAMARLRVAGKI